MPNQHTKELWKIMTENATTFRSLRKGRGLSQTEMAQMLGVSQKLVSEWERGVTDPKPYIYFAMAYIFNVDYDKVIASRANKDHNKIVVE